ncbi:hypothetical protein [Clostridium sp.]|uniref:hypothetical protein n=1 Tax=Clostridium sp. TaxID=1506 RepID=UPI00283ACD97|nr:hypothetical protein [Clostridium sp.]MDR3594660.1 hypothetical protein [Clostridium sp.]
MIKNNIMSPIYKSGILILIVKTATKKYSNECIKIKVFNTLFSKLKILNKKLYIKMEVFTSDTKYCNIEAMQILNNSDIHSYLV